MVSISPVNKSRLVIAVALVTGVGLCLLWLATPQPLLLDHCDYNRQEVVAAPVVVVGVLETDVTVRPWIPMHSDPKHHVQLRRLSVRVENVLRGSNIPSVIQVLYFTWADGFDGPRPLGFWRVPCRRILWLRTDSGALRTACDGWDGCTEGVWSGAHPGYALDPTKPIEFALVDFHLTRGEGPVNKIAFAAEALQEFVGIPGIEEYTIGKLRHLALTEQDEIKSSACKSLWIYTMDLVKPNIKSAAMTAMKAANCECNKKLPHGNVECE